MLLSGILWFLAYIPYLKFGTLWYRPALHDPVAPNGNKRFAIL